MKSIRLWWSYKYDLLWYKYSKMYNIINWWLLRHYYLKAIHFSKWKPKRNPQHLSYTVDKIGSLGVQCSRVTTLTPSSRHKSEQPTTWCGDFDRLLEICGFLGTGIGSGSSPGTSINWRKCLFRQRSWSWCMLLAPNPKPTHLLFVKFSLDGHKLKSRGICFWSAHK